MHQPIIITAFGCRRGRQAIYPFVTGPGLIKLAMHFFMRSTYDPHSYNKVQPGLYVGVDNQSITVVLGDKRGKTRKFVICSSIGGGAKFDGYEAMGMLNFSTTLKKKRLMILFYEHFYNKEVKGKAA
jgi:hypothetical protein